MSGVDQASGPTSCRPTFTTFLNSSSISDPPEQHPGLGDTTAARGTANAGSLRRARSDREREGDSEQPQWSFSRRSTTSRWSG